MPKYTKQQSNGLIRVCLHLEHTSLFTLEHKSLFSMWTGDTNSTWWITSLSDWQPLFSKIKRRLWTFTPKRWMKLKHGGKAFLMHLAFPSKLMFFSTNIVSERGSKSVFTWGTLKSRSTSMFSQKLCSLFLQLGRRKLRELRIFNYLLKYHCKMVDEFHQLVQVMALVPNALNWSKTYFGFLDAMFEYSHWWHCVYWSYC